MVFVFQQISYDKNGRVEDFSDSFGRGKWEKLGRITTINGQESPVISMTAGEVQRWRFIHGGVRETLMLSVCPKEDKKNADCKDMNEIAVDGLALGRIDKKKEIELQPGYRSDVLVQITEPGTYELVDQPTEAVNSLRLYDEKRKVLAKIEVTESDEKMELPKELADYAPFKHIKKDEVKKYQLTEFKIENGKFQINSQEYNPDDKPQLLKVGQAEEWILTSQNANHPFHIHVNPFEVITTDENCQEKGVWRDTIFVKQNEPVVIRTRYNKYIGKSVLHCHILDHEDQGMMAEIEFKE